MADTADDGINDLRKMFEYDAKSSLKAEEKLLYERDGAAMDRYVAAAPKGTPVKWYDTGHELNDPQALVDRAAWLKDKLGTGALPKPIERQRKRTTVVSTRLGAYGNRTRQQESSFLLV